MNTSKESAHFAGLDWASDHHDLCIIDAQGVSLLSQRFAHTAEGWRQMGACLAAYPGIAVAVETSHGIVIEQLLEMDVCIYPVNPKAAKLYRNSQAPSGKKNDSFDAWSLADQVRTGGQKMTPLMREDPLIEELRLLCRDEVRFIEQRTALVNQLGAALSAYYPAALEAFDSWTVSSSWAFIKTFPDPQALAKAGKRRWEKFLHAHGLWKSTTKDKRMDCFSKATGLVSGAALSAAKRMEALALISLLEALEVQLDLYRERIEALFNKHPHHDVFNSLPGAGPKLAPRLLAELGDQRARFASPEELQCYAGAAPVSFTSGHIHRVKLRRGVNRFLRTAVHLWCNESRRKCAWAQAYYTHQRQRGKSHACALRCLGQRWLKILWKMWQDGKTYDEALHTRNQIAHGSWILQVKSA